MHLNDLVISKALSLLIFYLFEGSYSKVFAKIFKVNATLTFLSKLSVS